MTIQEAAERLGLRRQSVDGLVKRGHLESRLILGDDGKAHRMIPVASVEAELVRRSETPERRGKGRPPRKPPEEERGAE